MVGAIAYGGLYTFPAVSVAFAREFGANRTLAVTPWTVFLLVSGLASPLLGRAYDVFLDRWLLSAGMALLAAGWAAVAIAPDVSFLVLAYGVALAIGLDLVFVGTSTAIARRYAGLTGLALGIAYAGPGIGVAVALPLIGPALESVGWRGAAVAFGVASIAGLPFVWLMTSGPPILFPVRHPAGGLEERARRRATEHRAVAEQSSSGLHETSGPGAIAAAQEPMPPGAAPLPGGLRRVLRTRRFWILFAGALAIGVFDEGVYQAFIPQATGRGIDPNLAARALGLESLSYVVGQVVGGWLSDRAGRLPVGLAVAALVGLGTTAAFAATGDAPALAVVGIVVHGVGVGATIAVRSAAFADVFGGRGFGALFGVLAVAYPIGGMVAVYVGGVGADRLGTYWPVYGLVLVALVAWATALWTAGPRRHGQGATGRTSPRPPVPPESAAG